ncbi:MAG: serpin family protein [Planctomycetota bacterium]
MPLFNNKTCKILTFKPWIFAVAIAVCSSFTPSVETQAADLDEANDASADLIDQQNQFGLQLWKELATRDNKNLFCSPMNVHTALSLLEPGADGETRAQLRRLLYGDQATAAAAYPDFVRLMTDNKQTGVNIEMASQLWTRSGLTLLPAYRSSLLNRSSGIEQLDFKGQPEASLETINDWVKDSTNEMIDSIATRDNVRKDTQLFLASAIYFKGKWTNEFTKAATRPMPFHLANETTMMTPMMRRSMSIRTVDSDGFRVAFLPYGDQVRRMEMVVLLPNEGINVDKMLQGMDASGMETLLRSRGRITPTIVMMPKMKFATEYNLVEALESLGMPQAFTDRADFSGITSDERLKISSVVHKAVIEVDEQGTEAAAVTGISMARATSVAPSPIIFKMDRPFAFMIRDRETGSILFVGRFNRPQQPE